MRRNNTEFSSRVFSGVIWKFGERLSAQLVTFVVTIILARILTPKEYGVVALITIFISIANVFVTSGFGSALIQKADADEVDFSSVFYFNIIFSLIIYSILFISAPYIAAFYNNDILCVLLRVLSIRIPIAAINAVQQAYVSRNMIFKKFFLATLFGTILSGFVGIMMAYYGLEVWAIVGQYLTNTIIDTIVLWFTVKWRPILRFSIKRVKGLIRYGWKILASDLVNTGYVQLRSLIIGKKYTASDLAYYNKGQQYPSLIVTNINSSISSVLFSALSKYQDNVKSIKNMTRKAIVLSSYIIWPIMIGLAVCSKQIVSILLTDKWLPCVPYLQITCLSYGFWPIHTANLGALKATGRSDLYLKLELIKKVLAVIALVISMNFGVMSIAISAVAVEIFSTIINAYPNRKLLKYKYTEQLKDMAPSFLLSIFMGVIVYSVSFFNMSSGIMLLIQVIIGGLVYISGSIIFRFKSFIYLVSIILKYPKKSKVGTDLN